MRKIGFWLLVSSVIALVALLHGCAQVQSAFGIPPTQQQVTNCLNWITQQANLKAIPSAQLSADLTALGATPPSLPADCTGHT
jgi:hypothetical protein